MSLIEQIKADQLAARKARDAIYTSVLTTLLGEVGLVAKNAGRELATDDEVIVTIKKFIKNNESIPDGARFVTHDAELSILEAYLPQQLTRDQIQQFFALTQPINKGAAMRLLKDNHGGRYDGKLAAEIWDTEFNGK